MGLYLGRKLAQKTWYFSMRLPRYIASRVIVTYKIYGMSTQSKTSWQMVREEGTPVKFSAGATAAKVNKVQDF